MKAIGSQVLDQIIEKLVDSDNEAIALGAIKEVLGRTNPMPKQANIAVQVTHTDAHLLALKQLADKTRERMTIDITPNSQTADEVTASEPIGHTEERELIGTQLIEMIDESDADESLAGGEA